jgi:hypothetical protein
VLQFTDDLILILQTSAPDVRKHKNGVVVKINSNTAYELKAIRTQLHNRVTVIANLPMNGIISELGKQLIPA